MNNAKAAIDGGTEAPDMLGRTRMDQCETAEPSRRFPKVLITGCAGMLGQAIYPYFAARCSNVLATDRVVNEPWLQELDILHAERLRDVFEQFRPNLVLHLAAETGLEFCETHPDLAEATNSHATRDVAELCESTGTTLVYISTAGVFDGEKDGFYTEDDVPNPIMVYGRTKLGGEHHARQCTRSYVVRAGWMVGGGPGKDHKFVSKILAQVLDDVPVIHAVRDKWGTPTYTRHFSANLFRLLHTDAYGTYHMVCEGSGTRYDVAVELVQILGRNDIAVRPVDSCFFQEEYFAPRPRSEMLMNANLRRMNLNLMGHWKDALREYVHHDYASTFARASPDAARASCPSPQLGDGRTSATVSTVIVNWNFWSHLQRCLEALCKIHDQVCEIVVVDNGSQDGSVSNVRKEFPHVVVQANATNLGYARAVNQGLGLVVGRYVLLLDPDTKLSPDSFAMLLDFMEKHPEASVVAPRTYYPDGTVQESARDFPSAMNALFGRQSLLTRLFDNPFSRRYLMRHKLHATEPFEVQQVSSACMLLRREVVDQAGPFDEGYNSYWADTEWCMRLRRMGKIIYCVPAASVIHYEQSRRGRKKSQHRIWLFHRDAYQLYWKNYTWGRWDPRAVFAFVALTARAALFMAWNLLPPLRAQELVSQKTRDAGAEIERVNSSR